MFGTSSPDVVKERMVMYNCQSKNVQGAANKSNHLPLKVQSLMLCLKNT